MTTGLIGKVVSTLSFMHAALLTHRRLFDYDKRTCSHTPATSITKDIKKQGDHDPISQPTLYYDTVSDQRGWASQK